MFAELQCLLPLASLFASSDGSTVSDSVSLHILTSHSFEDPQGLLPMLAFLTSTEGRIVSDSVKVPFKALSKETLKAL